MRFSLRWLRDYAQLDASLDLITRTLVDTGTEVGAVASAAEGLVVARVTRLEPVAGSTHGLRLVDIDVGPSAQGPAAAVARDRTVSLVTGAPNIQVGDLVPYAPPGTRPPAMDQPLGTRTYMGRHRSPGMICSAAELGVGDDAAGVLVLEAGTPGQPLADVLPLDAVLDLEVTTNRPDCLCHLGIARELAAALGETLSEPLAEAPESAVAASQRAEVAIDDEGCRRFAVRVLEDVRVGPSPAWIQERLRAVGLRPINNVVDITNFVAHELGQPLHAFDLDRLAAASGGRPAQVVVRGARPGERLTTLDGVDRELAEHDLVVCAGDRVASLAGVMGGLETAVSDDTRNILLEAASWDPVRVRTTSRRLGLRTDASALFEKGLSDTLPAAALDRAAALIAQSGGGHVLSGHIDEWPYPLPEIGPITVTSAQIEALLGMPVDATEAATALAHLGFAVEQDGASLIVSPPHFRRDVTLREDVIEEVGRLLGYDRVPSTLPGRRVPVGAPAPDPPLDDQVRDVCLGAGFDEAITFSFVSRRSAESVPGLGGSRRPMPLLNPLSDEWAVMRTSQLPGLCASLALNVNRGIQGAALFEVGRVFWDGERADPVPGSTPGGEDASLPGLPLEPLLLGVAVHSPGGAEAAAAELRHVQALFDWLAAELSGAGARWEPRAALALRPGRSAVLVAGGRDVAMIGELASPERLDLRGRVLVGEMNIDALTPAEPRRARFTAPPRFPAVVHDISVIVPGAALAGDGLEAARQAGGPLLEEAVLYDEFRGSAVEPGSKGWTFRLTFRAPDRTLAGDEALDLQRRIEEALISRCGAKPRR